MQRLFSLIVSFTLLFWGLFPGISLAENILNNLNNQQIQELIEIKASVNTIQELNEKNIISNSVAETEIKQYLDKTESIIKRKIELKELESINFQEQQGLLQKVKGFLTFVNIIATLAAILLAIAVAWLVSIYLIPVLKLIPKSVYEILIYLMCFAFIIGGKWLTPAVNEFIALPGCLGLIGALGFTNFLHGEALKKVYFKADNQPRFNPYYLNSLVLFFCWFIIAILYQSELIGFLAVIALEVSLGFSVVVLPLCYFIGFRERDVIPRAMSASLFLLIIYVGLKITETELPYVGIFSSGVLFVGSFVYYLGCLIISNKWYNQALEQNRYLSMQILTIVSGILALYIGSVWQILLLQRIGGTFFVLYLIDKYLELPWKKEWLAWATLGFAIILYSLALFVKQYPQFFLIY